MIKNLKQLRTQKGISQQKLADAINISQQSINKYENHKIEPDIQTLIDLANFFETSIDYLVGHSDVNHVVEKITQHDLNKDEEKIINNYRKLSAKQKECIRLVIENLIS